MRVLFGKAALVVAFVLLASYPAGASGIFLSNYSSTTSFGAGTLTGPAGRTMTPTGIAFDGTSYWSVGGGNYTDPAHNVFQYSSSGLLLSPTNGYSTTLDFRSIFTDAAGNIFAKQFSDAPGGDPTNPEFIYQMTSPGTFTPLTLPLGNTLADWSTVGGLANPGAQIHAGVVTNTNKTEFIALDGYDNTCTGTCVFQVDRWDSTTGAYLGNVALSGFGSELGQDSFPQNRGIASAGGYYLTYNDDLLTAWNPDGTFAGSTALLGGAVGYDDYSFSYANGMVWTDDNGTWKGYDVGLGGGTPTDASPVPEPGSIVLFASGLLAFAGFRKLRQLGTC